jgi:hypothetical protein
MAPRIFQNSPPEETTRILEGLAHRQENSHRKLSGYQQSQRQGQARLGITVSGKVATRSCAIGQTAGAEFFAVAAMNGFPESIS